MNEGFSRDSTNKVDSLCLIHFEGGALPEARETELFPDLEFNSIIKTTSLNPNWSLQELKRLKNERTWRDLTHGSLAQPGEVPFHHAALMTLQAVTLVWYCQRSD